MFHIMPLPVPGNTATVAVSDSIKQLILNNLSRPIFIAPDTRPADNFAFAGFPDDHWCKIVRPFDNRNPIVRRYSDAVTNGSMMADDIGAWLNGSRGVTPGRVMIDEVASGSLTDINACVDRLRFHTTNFPYFRSRSGAFVQAGRGVSFRNWEPTLRNLMSVSAIVAPEFYARHSDYCNNGRDAWLKRFFYTGEDTVDPVTGTRYYTLGGRYDWLWSLGSQYPGQPYAILLGVSDRYAADGRPNPAWFLDRQMYNLRSQRGAGQLTLAAANGGADAFKWDAVDPAVEYRVTNSSRDQAFVDSWNWYSGGGNNTLRAGIGIPC